MQRFTIRHVRSANLRYDGTNIASDHNTYSQRLHRAIVAQAGAWGRAAARNRLISLARATLAVLPDPQCPVIFPGIAEGGDLGGSQKRAVQNYRSRLSERGLARFEVLGLGRDRDLIRSLARRLAQEDTEAARIRAAVSRTISGGPPKKGGILAALRRSPLVGADLDLDRPRAEERGVDL